MTDTIVWAIAMILLVATVTGMAAYARWAVRHPTEVDRAQANVAKAAHEAAGVIGRELEPAFRRMTDLLKRMKAEQHDG